MDLKTARAETLQAFSTFWEAGDIAGVIDCFSPDAEYFSSVGPYPGERAKGHAEISNLISRMIAHDRVAKMEILNVQQSRDTAFWTWRYTDQTNAQILGCDLFKFDGAKIALKDAYRKVQA